MKLLFHLFVVITTLSTSCDNQEKNEVIINYFAQTRGFIYSINLNQNVLEINDNNNILKVNLNKNQLAEIVKILNNMDFNEIKNNLEIDDLAVDKAIKGIFKTKFEEKSYNFEFNHNELSKSIQFLFKKLEQYAS